MLNVNLKSLNMPGGSGVFLKIHGDKLSIPSQLIVLNEKIGSTCICVVCHPEKNFISQICVSW